MKGFVYKIECHLGSDKYIGSTTTEIELRYKRHFYDYNKYKKGKHNKTSVFDLFDKYGFENCIIVIIEELEFIDKVELRQREQYWIDITECVNIKSALQTREKYLYNKKQYYIRNKQTSIEYREKNKERIKTRKRQYYIENKEKILDRKRKKQFPPL